MKGLVPPRRPSPIGSTGFKWAGATHQRPTSTIYGGNLLRGDRGTVGRARIFGRGEVWEISGIFRPS